MLGWREPLACGRGGQSGLQFVQVAGGGVAGKQHVPEAAQHSGQDRVLAGHDPGLASGRVDCLIQISLDAGVLVPLPQEDPKLEPPTGLGEDLVHHRPTGADRFVEVGDVVVVVEQGVLDVREAVPHPRPFRMAFGRACRLVHVVGGYFEPVGCAEDLGQFHPGTAQVEPDCRLLFLRSSLQRGLEQGDGGARDLGVLGPSAFVEQDHANRAQQGVRFRHRGRRVGERLGQALGNGLRSDRVQEPEHRQPCVIVEWGLFLAESPETDVEQDTHQADERHVVLGYGILVQSLADLMDQRACGAQRRCCERDLGVVRAEVCLDVVIDQSRELSRIVVQ